MSSPLGVLVGGKHVVCLSCYDDDSYKGQGVAQVYSCNLEGYDQNCHDCNRSLTNGRLKTQLYDGGERCGICIPLEEAPAIALRAAAPDVEVGND